VGRLNANPLDDLLRADQSWNTHSFKNQPKARAAQSVKEAAIILTNFRRPASVSRQLADCRHLAELFDIFVIDNAPTGSTTAPDNVGMKDVHG